MNVPLPYRWTGDSFEPLRPKQADAVFVIGQVYTLEEVHSRSGKTHNHYFACLHDAWLNLPENMAEDFVNEEHFRKWALIRCGFCDSRTYVAPNKADAVRVAALVKPLDSHAVVMVRDCVLTVLTARSQSVKAMGAKEFQASKTAVLDYVAGLVGAKSDQLGRAA